MPTPRRKKAKAAATKIRCSRASATEQVPRPTADWAKSEKLLGFIMRLSMTGNVTRALNGARVDRTYAYDKRNTDIEFAAAWDDAKKVGLDVLKDEAWRRAHEGVKRDKFYLGKKIATEIEYSDTLLMFLIKQADPSYREHYDVNLGNAGGRPFLFQMQLHPVAAAQVAAQHKAVAKGK